MRVCVYMFVCACVCVLHTELNDRLHRTRLWRTISSSNNTTLSEKSIFSSFLLIIWEFWELMRKGNKSACFEDNKNKRPWAGDYIALIGNIDPNGPVQYDTHTFGEGLWHVMLYKVKNFLNSSYFFCISKLYVILHSNLFK